MPSFVESTLISSPQHWAIIADSRENLCMYLQLCVGQMVQFPPNNEGEADPPVFLLTSGKLLVSASWAVDNDGKALAPPHPQGNVATSLRCVTLLVLV